MALVYFAVVNVANLVSIAMSSCEKGSFINVNDHYYYYNPPRVHQPSKEREPLVALGSQRNPTVAKVERVKNNEVECLSVRPSVCLSVSVSLSVLFMPTSSRYNGCTIFYLLVSPSLVTKKSTRVDKMRRSKPQDCL